MKFEDILYRISQGDETAFEELFNSYFAGLLFFAKSFLKNQQLAEEVVEDVFVRLWENRVTAIKIQKLPVYLYTAVRYASIDALKKQKKFKSISFEDVGETTTFSYQPIEGTLISKENYEKISRAINQMPDRSRLIFRLIKEEGMKYKEVAQVLNISGKTVENQMNIAIKKLIELLKADFPEFYK